jgi:hypothetical protein
MKGVPPLDSTDLACIDVMFHRHGRLAQVPRPNCNFHKSMIHGGELKLGADSQGKQHGHAGQRAPQVSSK